MGVKLKRLPRALVIATWAIMREVRINQLLALGLLIGVIAIGVSMCGR